MDVLFCFLYLVDAQTLVQSRSEISYENPTYPNPPWLFVPRLRPVWIIAVAMSSWNLMSALIRFIFADHKYVLVIIYILETGSRIQEQDQTEKKKLMEGDPQIRKPTSRKKSISEYQGSNNY